MSNTIQNQDNFKEALCDVRVAFRLLKEYQQKMLDVVSYIKEQYSMPELSGNKHFCHPMRSKKNSYGKLDVRKDMWAWDFLYSYELEYYLGKIEEGECEYALSILQISDTGFYDSLDKDKYANNIDCFNSPEDSSSYLIFVLEYKKKEANWLWSNSDKILETRDRILQTNTTIIAESTGHNGYFIATKYPIAEFFNQNTCDNVLSTFNDLVRSKTKVQLLKSKLVEQN